MRRSFVFATSSWSPLKELTIAAEAAGFHRVWTTEGPRRDAFVRAAALAAVTSRIGIGTGIALAFQRSPVATGSAALDLARVSDGRFVLGLGPGTRGVRRAHGDHDIDGIARWFEEYVAVVRAVCDTSTSRIRATGKHFNIDISAARLSGGDAPPAVPQIYGAALNPGMIRAVGRSCDGIGLLTIGSSPEYVDEVVAPALRAGRAGAGRSGSIPMSSWCVVSMHADREIAREIAKRQLGFYFSTPSYRGAAAVLGLGERADAIQAAFRASSPPDWGRVVEEVGDDLVDQLTVSGDPGEVRSRFAAVESALADRGVDEIVIQIPATLQGDEYLAAGLALVDVLAPAAAGARPVGMVAS